MTEFERILDSLAATFKKYTFLQINLQNIFKSKLYQKTQKDLFALVYEEYRLLSQCTINQNSAIKYLKQHNYDFDSIITQNEYTKEIRKYFHILHMRFLYLSENLKEENKNEYFNTLILYEYIKTIFDISLDDENKICMDKVALDNYLLFCFPEIDLDTMIESDEENFITNKGINIEEFQNYKREYIRKEWFEILDFLEYLTVEHFQEFISDFRTCILMIVRIMLLDPIYLNAIETKITSPFKKEKIYQIVDIFKSCVYYLVK